jgi:hypothetical protein
LQRQTALLSVIVMVCDSVVVTDDFSYPCGGQEGGGGYQAGDLLMVVVFQARTVRLGERV